MLSRLSGLANTVLQELSGEGEDVGTGALPAGSALEPSQQNGEENPEDVLERLAHVERLVVQLKDLVREKDAQLQQKDASIQEERQAADAKLAKLKLQAKAKLASLNKRIEELTEQTVAAAPTEGRPEEPPPPSMLQCDHEIHNKQEEELEALQRRLQEQEAVTGKLQEQLEEATRSLKEAQAQLSSLQGVIQEKDSCLEEQARQHQAELQKLVAQSTLEAEMQQNLRLLQRKLEEQEAALVGRTQVVELLQQELDDLMEQKQVLLEKFQRSEAELESLRRTSASEKQQSQSLVERLELELAERKLACHGLQEEVQQLSQELAQTRAAEDAHEHESRASEKRLLEELEEKSRQIAELQQREQDLRSSYSSVLHENSQRLHGADQPLEHSAKQVSTQPGELLEGSLEQGRSHAQPEVLAVDTLEVVSTLDKPLTEQDEASPPGKKSHPESEQLKSLVENLETENESLRAKLALLESRLEFMASAAESGQVSCAGAGLEASPLLVSGISSSFGDGCSGPGDSLDGIGSIRAESLDSPTVPAILPQPSPGGSVEDLPVGENGHPDIVQYLSSKKHKDLSVLLLELQEAQEEVAFLKGQLPDSNSPVLKGDVQPEGRPLSSAVEGAGGQDTGLIQSDLSSSSLITVEIQEETPPLLGIPSEQESLLAEGSKAPPESPLPPLLQPQDLGKVPPKTAELHSSWQEREEFHKEALDEKVAEIERLQKLLEDSNVTLCTLTAERDQLLSQLKELSSLGELKEQVRQLEGNLADSEKQRLSDYESGSSQLGLLKEQIQSLENEAKSKEMKIKSLQRDLDEAQHSLTEQDLLARSLRSQLQKEEQERCALAECLQEASAKVEELSQRIISKDMEANRLVSERSAQTERLQQEAVEREKQLTEISVSMSDRMVQLNEEKFVLGKELKGLQEQLSQLLQGKETRDLGVGTDEETGQQAQEMSSAGEEVEALRKENEQVKKKLQAALVSRKALLSRVRKMEKPLESGERQPGESGIKAPEVGGGGEPSGIGTSAGVEGNSESQVPDASLSQLLSAKEAELQMALKEKESAVAELQAVIAELQQGLQEKDLLIGALEAEAKDHKKQALESCTSEPGQEELQKTALEEKIFALEQEKEQLQKKLHETLASRKDTVKKAQEKDRHHREQLKQQKDDYNLLQERFDEQSREKESIHDQLQLLQAQVQMLEKPPFPKPDAEALPEGAQQTLASVQEPDGEKVPADSEMRNFLANGSCLAAEEDTVGQLKTELEKLQAEKGELEAQIHCLEGELLSKSEAVLELQEQARQLVAETEATKAASREAEAKAMSLEVELEESRAELARLEGLRLHQVSLAEQRELTSKEEIEALNLQLVDKTESLHSLQAQVQEREDTVKALQGQLEVQAKEQTQRLQAELAEMQQKSAAEEPSRAQLQRKLQAALVSRKEVLRENKLLQEKLASTKSALENSSSRLSEAESQAFGLEKEKGALLEKLEAVTKEREKLIAEVDKALVENQNLSGSCESLKLALEGVTQEKARLEQDVDALRSSQAEELSEWQGKHQELQKEYETLLQSYENISSEAERIQRVVEGVRQEKQELFLKLKSMEAEKREVDARLQGAEQEMEGMREKMRKFAKSKQQKILELEEENERLRAEASPMEGGPGGEDKESARLQEELEDSKEDCRALSRELEALAAEKETLRQEICGLKQKLQDEEMRRNDTQGEAMADKEAVGLALVAPGEKAESEVGPSKSSKVPEGAAMSLNTEEEEESKARPPSDEINGYIQQVAQLTERVVQLEEMGRVEAEKLGRVLVDVDTLAEEKKCLEEQLAVKGQELQALQEKAFQLEQAHQQAEEQLAGMARLKEVLEAEKDDLEERLMNQLAELNGSIGNYQQDVVDLQSKNQQLLEEMETLQGALSRLEEEKRHLMREKTEVEAEKKEHVERLKSAWKDAGGRAQAKELQELLKEKQQEVRKLQKDCIKSQEKISSLERTIKALEFVQSESQKELEATKKSLAKAEEDTKKAQAELGSCRVLLDDTQSEAARVLAESLKAKEELQANKEQFQAQLRHREEELEQRLEQEKGKHAKELRNMEEKLEAGRREQARLAGAARGLQESLGQKDQEAKQLQGSLNQTLAQLAAFTRSMSSLQDDRDRVIDESRQWERKFSEAIEKKEQELRARGDACAALEEQVKQAAAQVEDLQSHIVSLEHSKLVWEADSQKELQQLQEEIELLKKENKMLTLQLERVQQLFSDAQNQLGKQDSELQSLREQLAELQHSFAKCQEAREEMESTVKRQEASLRECQFSQEQLETDLHASKELTDKLHEEISSKEQRIVSLLAAKEEAVAAAISELQQQHEKELKEMKNRIGKGEEECTVLENEKRKALEKVDHLLGKLKSAQEESKKHKAQLDSFTKSMSSLQDDRDRVLGDYQQLEQRHLSGILEKDQLIQEAAAENNKLKEEIRGLHSRMDDLHAENAKLDAELIRYREDLNQLISIKDSQQKQLSRAQLERIQALEKEKADTEGLLRESERTAASLQQSSEALRRDKQNLEQEVKALLASLSQMQGEVAALQEGGPMLELQAQLQAKVDEVEELSSQLSLVRQQVTELEEELALVHETTAQQMQEAEAKMKKEMRSLHHDAGLMRNETETAEERVAELARDLLEMEQNLLAVTEENQDLKAQIQSFGKAMSSLQDSWDQANEDLRAMEKKYTVDLGEQQSLAQHLQEEKAELQKEQQTLAQERGRLASELAALRDSVEEKGLLAQLKKLSEQLQARDAEVLRLSEDLEGASGQVKSFSKAMASLQGERDRLLSELDKSRRVREAVLQSVSGASASLTETESLKRALSSLQTDREQLLAELKSLQQQNLQAEAVVAELACLKAQRQEQKREAEQQQHLQEELRQQLQQLREEKAAWELETKEQLLSQGQTARRETRPSVAVVENHHQRQASPEVAMQPDISGLEAETNHLQAQLGSSLKELHQKELRIQKLNSKLSQVFEEKNALSLQLRGSSRSLRESQQRYVDILARCEALEKQLQQQPLGKNMGSLSTDAAPGAPQERSEHPRESYTPELQELQMRLSEAQRQQSSAKQGLLQLEELLQEEQDRRRAAEEALSAAQDHIGRLESNEWTRSLETSIDMPATSEHALLVGSSEGSFSKARQSTAPRRLLRSLFCSRTRLPLLATVYLLTVHVLLLLCLTGHL